jgi:hypothetical protein
LKFRQTISSWLPDSPGFNFFEDDWIDEKFSKFAYPFNKVFSTIFIILDFYLIKFKAISTRKSSALLSSPFFLFAIFVLFIANMYKSTSSTTAAG